MDAIEPIYGDKSRDFCLIETGYIGQMMMEKSPDFDLGLCPIGGFSSKVLQKHLGLTSQQQPLHALIGGAIDPSWKQQWMAIVRPLRTSSITETLTHTLQQHLSEKLPSCMVPARYHILDTLPLTTNGKIDRRALPTPSLGTTAKYVAPTTPTEKKITELWQTLLETDQVGLNDNFFEAGGNSLTAMQLLSQLQNTFAAELTITQLFGALTPAQQAHLVDQVKITDGQHVDTQSDNDQIADPIPRRHAETPLPNINELSDETVNDLLEQLLAEDNQEVNP